MLIIKKSFIIKIIKDLQHDLDTVFITLPNYLAVKVTSFF